MQKFENIFVQTTLFKIFQFLFWFPLDTLKNIEGPSFGNIALLISFSNEPAASNNSVTSIQVSPLPQQPHLNWNSSTIEGFRDLDCVMPDYSFCNMLPLSRCSKDDVIETASSLGSPLFCLTLETHVLTRGARSSF